MFAQDTTLIGDVDCSGEVNSQDASLILQFVTNVIDELPCEANMTGLTTEQLQEIINMMDEQLNINYSGAFPVEGWIDHDYQATWCCYSQCYAGGSNNDATWGSGCPSFEESNINIALSSGIVSVNTHWDAEGYSNGCAGNKILIYVNNELILETPASFDLSMSTVSFPVKKGNEFIIYTYCPNSNLNDYVSENNIKFFSFGDEEGSSSTNTNSENNNSGSNNNTLMYTVDGF